MEFDLQRFDEEEVTSAETQQAEEESPIPEELNGLPEEYAREAMTEWESQQPPAEPESQPEPAPVEEQISREDYQAKVAEIEQLKAQLARYQQPQPKQPQTIQPPQLTITPEISAKITEAITAEAMAMSNFSADDVASLEYADADDPRVAQWNQAKSLAQSRVLNAIQQAQIYHQQRTQHFLNEHAAAIQTYNEFAQKEFAEPDFKEIQNYATNDFFNSLSPNEQKILANSYLRVERQTASPAEMLIVKTYYERAKSAYRARGAKAKPATNQPWQTAQLPRVDQISGSATTPDGQLSPSDFEKLLEGDFTKLDTKTQNQLLGIV